MIPSADDLTTAYLTYQDFERINASSVKAKRNRTLYFDRLPISDDDTIYPIAWAMIHDDVEIRAKIIMNRSGDTAIIDMSVEDYLGLRRIYKKGGE